MGLTETNSNLAALRSVTFRLSSAPAWQLPHVAPVLAGRISESGGLLSTQTPELSADARVLVHKLKTQISTLLQDKSPQARWTGVVLAKATIEAGRYQVLQEVGPWIRSVIAILGKPDPVSTKKLCITTVTRIFLLSHGRQSLVREIMTPVLPAFITACLKSISSKSNTNLSSVALQALCKLLPHHPATFRPFTAQVRACILPLIAPTPATLSRELAENRKSVAETVANCSRRLFVLLNTCAPKKTENEAWTASLRLVVDTIHGTADRVFRSLVEDRAPSSTGSQDLFRSSTERVRSAEEDHLGLPGWVGIDAGIERLEGLLKLLQSFYSTATTFSVAVPVGITLSVVSRFLSLLVPANVSQSSARLNPEFERDEREPLLLALPRIHTLAIEVLTTLTERLGSAGVSFHTSTIQQCLWVLNTDAADDAVRAAIFRYVRQVVKMFGLCLPLRFKEAFSACLNLCCEELLPLQSKTSDDSVQANGSSDSRLLSHDRPVAPREAQLAADELLSLVNSHLTDDYLAQSMRAQIDRMAILTQHEDIMLSSVLYPSSHAAKSNAARSILPFLVRSFPDAKGTEALLRPRMPIIQIMPTPINLHLTDDIDADTQESNYAQLYSGSIITNQDHAVERKPLVEDSLQSDRQPTQSSLASVNLEPAKPIENNNQGIETSLVEVPETQLMTVTSKNKRDRDAFVAEAVPSYQSYAGAVDSMPQTEQVSGQKRLRTDETAVVPTEKPNVVDSSVQSASDNFTDPQSAELIVPSLATKTVLRTEKDSDSDDSSIHIDPTLDTEDEENSEDQSL